MHFYKGCRGYAPDSTCVHTVGFENLEGLDLGFLRDFCDGDEAQMQHFMQKFVEQCPLEIEQLDVAFQKGDREAIYQAAHRFKPQLEFVGLKKATQLTLQLEQSARTDITFDELMSILEKIKKVLRTVPPLQ